MTQPTKHPIAAYLDTLIEAYELIVISEDITNAKVKRLSTKKSMLYKASIISVCASWESYLEAATLTSLKCIIDNAENHNRIPTNLLLRISNRLKTEKDEKSLLKICGDGWKNEIQINFDLLKDKFNTPRPDKVDEFVYHSIGLKNLSHTWRWKGQSFNNSSNKLNEFMDLRGDITHRLKADKNVYSHLIHDYINFLYKIATISSNTIRKHTYDIVGVYPWKTLDLKRLLH